MIYLSDWLGFYKITIKHIYKLHVCNYNIFQYYIVMAYISDDCMSINLSVRQLLLISSPVKCMWPRTIRTKKHTH